MLPSMDLDILERLMKLYRIDKNEGVLSDRDAVERLTPYLDECASVTTFTAWRIDAKQRLIEHIQLPRRLQVKLQTATLAQVAGLAGCRGDELLSISIVLKTFLVSPHRCYTVRMFHLPFL